MKRLKVLFLPLASVDPIWQQEVVKAVAPRHDLAIYGAGHDLAGLKTPVPPRGTVRRRTDICVWSACLMPAGGLRATSSCPPPTPAAPGHK